MLVTEEQPVAAGMPESTTFLQEPAERRDALARANHDHRRVAVLGRPEVRGALQEHRRRRRPIGQEGRAHAAALPAVGAAVPNHRHGQLHLVRTDQGARRDRVVAGRQPHQDLLPLVRIGMHDELLHQIESAAPHQPFVKLVLRRAQHLRVAAVLGDEAHAGSGSPAEVVARDQRVAKGLLGAVDLYDVLPTHSRRGKPGVDDYRVIGGEHAERIACRVADVVLGDVEPELAHFFSCGRRGEHHIAAQWRDDGFDAGKRFGDRRGPGDERNTTRLRGRCRGFRR